MNLVEAFDAVHVPILSNRDRSAEARSAYRKAITRDDPLAFALTYLRHHLKDDKGRVTLSEVHRLWIAEAKTWLEPGSAPAENRDAFIAPRSMGKSTWFFLIFPLWMAAHGHVKFIAAFADSATQAEEHLSTFKSELTTNPLLAKDFPYLVSPLRRQRGAVVSDNRQMYQASNRFAFTAKGVDSGNLGLKVGSERPGLIICDDLEPGESNYSVAQAAKRLTTLLDDILPLNVMARVVIVGTTVMSNSIIDQLRQHGQGEKRATEEDERNPM